MPSKRSHLAAKAREKVFDIIGWKCVLCGSTTQLEVDHPLGRDWCVKKANSYYRNLRYLKEARTGLLRCLCNSCNNTFRPTKNQDEGDPF